VYVKGREVGTEVTVYVLLSGDIMVIIGPRAVIVKVVSVGGPPHHTPLD